MKTSLTKSKSSFIAFLALMALPLWAKPVALVTELKGQVFVVTPEGKTSTLKMGDKLEDKSEIMIEEGGSVTLNDYYDATYHMIGGGHMKFFNGSAQLKRGKTWVQSKAQKHQLALTTANGHVTFSKGEFITTFDHTSSRSQVLVVHGEVEVSNVLDKNMKYTVPAGQFTLIDPEVENGTPRTPTKVGLNSLNAALQEFKQMPKEIMEPSKAPERKIASVSEEGTAIETKKGEIIFIKSNRLPASVMGSAHSYYKKTASKKWVSKKATAESIPVKIYGTAWKDGHQTSTPRTPASVPKPHIVTPKVAPVGSPDQEFDLSLKKESAAQPKHSKELEGLIDELKSF